MDHKELVALEPRPRVENGGGSEIGRGRGKRAGWGAAGRLRLSW